MVRFFEVRKKSVFNYFFRAQSSEMNDSVGSPTEFLFVISPCLERRYKIWIIDRLVF